jgi:hypothetical protein
VGDVGLWVIKYDQTFEENLNQEEKKTKTSRKKGPEATWTGSMKEE